MVRWRRRCEESDDAGEEARKYAFGQRQSWRAAEALMTWRTCDEVSLAGCFDQVRGGWERARGGDRPPRLLVGEKCKISFFLAGDRFDYLRLLVCYSPWITSF